LFHLKYLKMKKIALRKAIFLLTLSFCAAALQSFGQDKKTATITGEVLDMACYSASGASGEGHKSCAESCIKRGAPMGLLTSDGKVYLIVENHDKKDAYEEAKKHAGEKITATGTLSDKGGLQTIIVDEVKAKS
jgi:hypothetical protein